MAKTPVKPGKKKRKPPVPAPTAQATNKENTKPRQVQAARYKSFRLQKRLKSYTDKKLPGAFKLLRASLGVIRRNWKVFFGIALIYALLTTVLVQGFATTNLSDARASFDKLFSGHVNQFASGATLFVYLLGSSGNTTNPTAGVYQLILGILVTLAVIWTLRQVYAGNTVRIRDGFYQGMYPLIPFLMVLLVIGLQLLPMVVGSMLYTTVIRNGIAATPVEVLLWLLAFALLTLLSAYMICSSLFALYIVCLPGMTPLAALRAARDLVRSRRWAVLRKIVFLPVALVILAALIMIPLISFVTPLAPWVFFALTMLFLPVVNSYLYALYRSML